MRKISRIVVHCSDSPHGRGDDVNTIRKWHVEERGWSDVGYHFVITETGDIQRGRPLERIGAHVRGFNRDSVGVCLIGRTSFTEAQDGSLRVLLDDLMIKFPNAGICGHRDLDPNKTCPNFDVHAFLCPSCARQSEEEG